MHVSICYLQDQIEAQLKVASEETEKQIESMKTSIGGLQMSSKQASLKASDEVMSAVNALDEDQSR